MEMLLEEIQHGQTATAPIGTYNQIWEGRHAQNTSIRREGRELILNSVPFDSWGDSLEGAFQLLNLILEPLEKANISDAYDPTSAKVAMHLILHEAVQHPDSIRSAIDTIKDMRGDNKEKETDDNPWSSMLDQVTDNLNASHEDAKRFVWKGLTAERRTQLLEATRKLLKPYKEGIAVDPVVDQEMVSRPPESRAETDLKLQDRGDRLMPFSKKILDLLGVSPKESRAQSYARLRKHKLVMERELRFAELGKQIVEEERAA